MLLPPSTSVVVVLNVFEPLNFGNAAVVISQYTGTSCFTKNVNTPSSSV